MRKISNELINALIDVVKTRADETLSRIELDKLTALKSQLENLPKIEEAGKDMRDQYQEAKDMRKQYQEALKKYQRQIEGDRIKQMSFISPLIRGDFL